MKRVLRVMAGMVLACAVPCLGGWILDGKPAASEGAAATGGGTNVVVTSDQGTFPVLRLELGGQWTDFELKASTNNFASLVYYVKSSGTNAYEDDTNVWIYFTDDYAGDLRRWVKSAPGTGIWSQLVEPTNSVVGAAIVCPSHECVVNWEGWMSPTNERLVWSYVRYDGIDLERNASGTKTRWSAAVPVEWRKQRIAP
jgi:hypothetical protein